MVKKKKSSSKKIDFVKKHLKNPKVIVGIIVLLVVIIVFGAKLYLFFQLMLGNDLLVSLNVDEENLFLRHGEYDEVEIKASVFANAFCRVSCDYSFTDLSSDVVHEQSSFTIGIVDPVRRSYIINSPLVGSGQKLYRFDISCTAQKTYFCQTEEEEKKNSLLITLDYGLTEQEEIAKKDLASYFRSLVHKNEVSVAKLNTLRVNSNIINTTFKYKTPYNLSLLEQKQRGISLLFDDALSLWKEENFTKVKSHMELTEKTLDEFDGTITEFNASLFDHANTYNLIIEEISSIESYLESYLLEEFSPPISQEIDSTIVLLNDFKINFSNNFDYEVLIPSFEIFKDSYIDLEKRVAEDLASPSTKSSSPAKMINNVSLVPVSLIDEIFVESIPYELEDPFALCQYKNDGASCCEDTCKFKEDNFPVLFIHGHDFSSEVSFRHNLEVFEEMQRLLEKDGVINAGELLVNVPEAVEEGVWGRYDKRFSLRSSYYFDTLRNRTEFAVLETKEDNIDTYAIRLKEIIKTVKEKTGKDKVVLVTHSMGGLVARRYVQLFGEQDVQLIIMVVAPNHGIDERDLRFCKLFGFEDECDDMAKGSLLINKLDNQIKPVIPIHNIIGVGCETKDVGGDGVVTEESQFLDFAENYYVEGSCEGFEYLHTEIVDPYKYNETYEIIKGLLV